MSARERFWETVCPYHRYLMPWLAVLAALFVLTAFTLVFGTPGTGAYRLAIINLLLLLGLTGAMGGVVYVCTKRQQEAY